MSGGQRHARPDRQRPGGNGHEGGEGPDRPKEKPPPRKLERFDPDLKVWDVATGLITRGIVVVGDLASGKELLREARDEQFHAVAFDSKGRVFVGGENASGGAVFGWDIATGKLEFTLQGRTKSILSLAFGPDERLATGGDDRVVKLWDLESRREVPTLEGFVREVTHLAFTPNGRDLVAATGLNLTNTMILDGMPSEWPPAEVRVFRGPK